LKTPRIMVQVDLTQSPATIVQIVIFAIYVVAATVAAYCLISKSKKTRNTWILVFAIGFSAFATSVELADAIISAEMVLTRGANFWGWSPLESVLWFCFIFSSNGMFGPNFIISDMLVVWRSSCFFPKAKFLAKSLNILLSGLLVFRFVFRPVFELWDQREGRIHASIQFYFLRLVVAMSCVSLLINLVVIVAIGYKLYQYKAVFHARNTPPVKSLAILVESGLMYLCVQACLCTSCPIHNKMIR
jgi:hypothetical protein